ncbi:MAG: flagellar hook-associated protein FlgL [Deltaproteobacteria bacterium]|nr:flagellar hook-associated protein FlgL [Deltaproteobacteria bacterium]
MRIANKTLYDNIITKLGQVTTDLMDAHEVVNTTKKINSLSDDPVGLVTVLNLSSSLENLEQMERNISLGKSWLTAGETALSQVQDILSQTKELCVQMSSANVDPTERYNATAVVDGQLRQILSLANTQSEGRYIFSGTNTETIPFGFNGTETQVLYSGNDTPFSIKTGKDTNIEIGRDGEDIFGGNWDDNNIFRTLMDLKTHLQGNDVTEIQATLTKLDAHLTTVRGAVSNNAGKTIRLNVRGEIIQDLQLTYTNRKSELEDADITEAIINLNAKELAYNAALNSASKVMKLSLVDYI